MTTLVGLHKHIHETEASLGDARCPARECRCLWSVPAPRGTRTCPATPSYVKSHLSSWEGLVVGVGAEHFNDTPKMKSTPRDAATRSTVPDSVGRCLQSVPAGHVVDTRAEHVCDARAGGVADAPRRRLCKHNRHRVDGAVHPVGSGTEHVVDAHAENAGNAPRCRRTRGRYQVGGAAAAADARTKNLSSLEQSTSSIPHSRERHRPRVGGEASN
jgi:hypothetical protein